MTTIDDLPGAPLPADHVLSSLLDKRFSCRGFQNRPVDGDTISRILELAQRSPSWCNTQSWQVMVTVGEATDRLRAATSTFAATNAPTPDLPFPERYDGVFLDRRRECGRQLYESVGIGRGDREASAREMLKNFAFFGAPHVAIITTQRDHGVYGVLDCGVYLAHFLLAAQSLGVATIPQAAFGAVAPVIREQFDLPDDRQVLCGVSFGYPDETHPANGFRTSRAAIDEIVRWET
jgi:nitroreductase